MRVFALFLHYVGMTDTQILTIVLASVPTTIAVLIGILLNNARLTDFRLHVDERFREVGRRFDEVDRRFGDVDRRFGDVDRRFEELKELWRAELHRVEEILDARLKHIEGR